VVAVAALESVPHDSLNGDQHDRRHPTPQRNAQGRVKRKRMQARLRWIVSKCWRRKRNDGMTEEFKAAITAKADLFWGGKK
jgi:hypothetical protein